MDFGVQFGTRCSGVLRQVGVLDFFGGGVAWNGGHLLCFFFLLPRIAADVV